MTERPSCCPLRTRNGRNTSTLLMYTEFSSKAPPRTLYCEESSLWVLTPACCCTRLSTPFPLADGVIFMSLVFSSCIWSDCIFSPLIFTSSSVVDASRSTTCRVCFPRGLLSTFVFVLKPIYENLTTTLSAECSLRL